MFWRILRRLLQTNRARLFVVLLALGAGAAVTSALLNLQVDAERRLTSEFRAFGANVVVTPRDAASTPVGKTLDEALLQQAPETNEGNRVVTAGFLYLVADASPFPAATNPDGSLKTVRAVVAGFSGGIHQQMLDSISTRTPGGDQDHPPFCNLGIKASSQLGVHEQQKLLLRAGSVEQVCSILQVKTYGGQEDNQIFVGLQSAQRLAGLPGRISLIQASVPGTPRSIEHYIGNLQERLPDADVHGIRQFTEAEAKLYAKIRGLLIATVALILILTGLCVMAAMTNVALERQRDVGLMKALGGAASRVIRLFLTEAALLGLIGGLVGAAAGIVLSMWLGRAVFGVAAQPRLIVYPVAVGLTVLVAIAGSFPLRRLAGVRPGEILRGVS